LKNKKVIVTGEMGFIGSHLTERLLEDNTIKVKRTSQQRCGKNMKIAIILGTKSKITNITIKFTKNKS